MKVIIFVIDNLYDDDDVMVKNFVSNYNLTKLYQYQNKIYILSKLEEFSKSDLVKFNVNK